MKIMRVMIVVIFATMCLAPCAKADSLLQVTIPVVQNLPPLGAPVGLSFDWDATTNVIYNVSVDSTGQFAGLWTSTTPWVTEFENGLTLLDIVDTCTSCAYNYMLQIDQSDHAFAPIQPVPGTYPVSLDLWSFTQGFTNYFWISEATVTTFPTIPTPEPKSAEFLLMSSLALAGLWKAFSRIGSH